MQIQPLRTLCLVRRYSLPERIGSIIVPDSWRKTGQTEWWELEEWGPQVEEWLGVTPVRGSLLQSEPWMAVALPEDLRYDLGYDAYILDVKHCHSYEEWQPSWEGE